MGLGAGPRASEPCLRGASEAGLEFEANPGTAVTFNGNTYPSGLTFSAASFVLFGTVKGSASITVPGSVAALSGGLTVHGTVQPFSIGSLLSLQGYSGGSTGTSSDATVDVSLSTDDVAADTFSSAPP